MEAPGAIWLQDFDDTLSKPFRRWISRADMSLGAQDPIDKSILSKQAFVAQKGHGI